MVNHSNRSKSANATMFEPETAGHVERGSFVVQKMVRRTPRREQSGFRVTHFFHGGSQQSVSHILPNYATVQRWMDDREAHGPRGGDWQANQAAANAFATAKISA
jgi:hypothetical protein